MSRSVIVGVLVSLPVFFALFDGVHRTCVTLASRLTAGPYETIDRALRLRLFLCVCGETWRDAPALRASALRRCHAFAREEDAHEAIWDSWRVRLNAPEENGIEYPDIVDDDEDDDPALHSEMDLEQRRRWRSDEEAKFACPSSNGPLRGVRRMFMKLCCDA